MKNIKNTLTDCLQELTEKKPKAKHNFQDEPDLPLSFPELLRTGMIAQWEKDWNGDFRKYVEITEGLPDDFAAEPPPRITPARIQLHRRAYLDWRKKNQNHPMYEWSEAETKMLEEKARAATRKPDKSTLFPYQSAARRR